MSRPIGIFDSGVGGLTVLKVLQAQFPNEAFIYLGDTARLPYGSKSHDTIHSYVVQNIQFLLKYHVKAVVIACHSASSSWLKNPVPFPVPVYEVIGPACAAALKNSIQKRVGLLATKATVHSQIYGQKILALEPEAYFAGQACPLLVPFVEEGLEDDPLTALIAHRYLHPLLQHNLESIILGCTHYPRLLDVFKRIARGSAVQFIDPGLEVAELLKADQQNGQLEVAIDPAAIPIQILTTDLSESFTEIARRIMFPTPLPAAQLVDVR